MPAVLTRRWLRLVSSVGLFAALFLFPFSLIVVQEEKNLRSEFRQQVNSAVDQIRGQLWSGLTAVSTLAAVGQDGKALSASEFSLIASRMREGQNLQYIMAVLISEPDLSWAIEIPSEHEAAGDARANATPPDRAEPVSPIAKNHNGKRIWSSKLAQVQRVEPKDHSVAALKSLDLFTFAGLKAAIFEAIDSASAVIIDGDKVPELQADYLIIKPWFRGATTGSSISERREAISAVYVAAGYFFDVSSGNPNRDPEENVEGQARIKHISFSRRAFVNPVVDRNPLRFLSTKRQFERFESITLPGTAEPINLTFTASSGFDATHALALGMLSGLIGLLLLRFWFQHRAAQQLLLINAQKAQEERKMAQQTLSMVYEGIVRTDATLRIRYYNEAAATLLATDGESLIGKQLGTMMTRLPESETSPGAQSAATASSYTSLADGDYLLATEGGDEPSLIHLLQTEVSVDGNDEKIFMLRDVGDERQRTRELEWHATRDSLTGLLNRRAFEDEVSTVISHKLPRHAVVYLDLDQFKVINDTAGHDVGDRMLQQVAGAIRMITGDQHVLARLGGDEFGLLMRNVDRTSAKNLIERILSAVRECRVVSKEESFNVGTSAGIVLLNAKHVSLRQALSDADKACYAAKRRGRNRAVFFQEDDRYIAQRQTDVHWLNELKDAIADGRFGLDVQPIYAVNDTGGPKELRELLLRMYATDGSVIAPGQFIPVAEQHDLMPQLDRWVIKSAFTALSSLEDDDEYVYSINLSSRTINETDLTEFVVEQAKATGVSPERICFELTETSAVIDAGHTSLFLSTMREYGFRIAIDDFGSGAASFSYLKKFPADILKVDRSLVVDAHGDKTSATLLEGLNNLALTLGIATVAEGLESASMVYMIQSMGFTYGQGFFLGRPAPFLRKDGSIVRFVNQVDEHQDDQIAMGL